MSLFLGIDIGTASSKGVLVREDGTVVAQANTPHDTASPHPGWSEHDALSVWWHDFRLLARRLLEQVDEPVAGVGCSGIGPCIVPVDEHGEPLRPAILYGVDTRATKEIAQQRDAFGDAEVLRRCGAPLTTQAIGPKLAWLRTNEPDVYRHTARWHMASSFVVRRLTGEYVLDHHSASQCVPLYDSTSHEWITEWCDRIAPGMRWPRLVWPSEVVGTVTADAARGTGLPQGIPVIAGTIDAWSESVSVGVLRPGDLMVMYGTTMFLVDVVAKRVTSPTMWGTVGAFEGQHCLAAGMATSGAITAWLSELTSTDYPSLVVEAAEVGVGAAGLLMLPYFAGERSPLFDPNARGVLIGLTTGHHRGHLYRAALEATAFGVRHNLEVMAEAGGSLDRLVAVGGGTQGRLWTQIVSDVLGREQELPRHTMGAAYGDAFMAAVGTGAVTREDIVSWNPVDHVVAPDAGNRAAYDERYRLYRELYPATRSIANTLAQS